MLTTHAFTTRLSISIAARELQTQFVLSNLEIGWMLSSFIVGYGLCQVPVGILADRLGPRRLLTAAVAAWSLFTGLTPLAPGVGSAIHVHVLGLFILVRFGMGVAQAAALPCGNKTVARWMPLRERAMGTSLFMLGLGLGGLIAPPLMVHLILRFGWPFPFYVLGIVGVLLAAAWFGYATDRPEQHVGVNSLELSYIQEGEAPEARTARRGTPWRPILASRSVWFLVLSYGVAGFPSYVFYTWFFLYVANVRKISLVSSGYWASLPYVAIAIMTPCGGRLSDWLTGRYGKRAGRLSVTLSGSIAAAILILAGSRIENATWAMICLSLAAGCHLFGQSPSWAASIDLAPLHSATLFGVMNTLAQAVGAAAPVLTPWIAQRFGWIQALDFTACMALLAGLFWLFVHPERPVE